MDKPIVAHDLPHEYFPFTIKAFNYEGEIIWQETVINPPVVLEVPGFGPGSVEKVVVEYANGDVISSDDT